MESMWCHLSNELNGKIVTAAATPIHEKNVYKISLNKMLCILEKHREPLEVDRRSVVVVSGDDTIRSASPVFSAMDTSVNTFLKSRRLPPVCFRHACFRTQLLQLWRSCIHFASRCLPHCLHFPFARHPRHTLSPLSESSFALRYIPQFVQNPENIKTDKFEEIH